jgi:hypothetical protein
VAEKFGWQLEAWAVFENIPSRPSACTWRITLKFKMNGIPRSGQAKQRGQRPFARVVLAPVCQAGFPLSAFLVFHHSSLIPHPFPAMAPPYSTRIFRGMAAGIKGFPVPGN